MIYYSYSKQVWFDQEIKLHFVEMVSIDPKEVI